MFYYYDPTVILLIPAMLFAMLADFMVRSSFKKYSRIRNSRNITGAEAARRILDRSGLRNVSIRPVKGQLTDNYDPRTKVLSLSEGVYSYPSISAVSVACHEVGHAIQHAEGYFPLKFRNAFVPVVNIAAKLTYPLILMGIFLLLMGDAATARAGDTLFHIGAAAFAVIVLFHLITLPVEFNASRRAVTNMRDHGVLAEEDMRGAKKVLRAAAMTYVAALAVAVGNLLRLLMIRGRNR